MTFTESITTTFSLTALPTPQREQLRFNAPNHVR
jgi:hypothetical protein